MRAWESPGTVLAPGGGCSSRVSLLNQDPHDDVGDCFPWAAAQKRATGCDTRPCQFLPLPPTSPQDLTCRWQDENHSETQSKSRLAPVSPGSTFGFIIIPLLFLFMDDEASILRHLEIMAHSSGPLGAWLGGCSQRNGSEPGKGSTSGGRCTPRAPVHCSSPCPICPTPAPSEAPLLTQHPLGHIGVQEVEGLVIFPFLQPCLALLPCLLPPLFAPLPFLLFLLLIL